VSSGFELVGAHTSLDCASCHIPPDGEVPFDPASQDDCIACHQADYEREHAGTEYPVTCLSCHDISAWSGAAFDHDAQYFPISRGKHSGRWASCATCHTMPDDYRIFTCLQCHQHDQSRMDSEHSGIGGYVYDSNACYSCHPTGSA
jgi:hypothetical protein